jgi:sugar phosphate permease
LNKQINIFATNIIHVSSSTSLTILLIFNLAGYPGRILPAILSDLYIGPLNTLILLSISCSILIYVWTCVSSFPSLIVFTVFYGIVNGGVQGLFISALASLTTDLSKMGTRMGMIFTILAFCTLTGAPIAGA